jgi:hypothetical protein
VVLREAIRMQREFDQASTALGSGVTLASFANNAEPWFPEQRFSPCLSRCRFQRVAIDTQDSWHLV